MGLPHNGFSLGPLRGNGLPQTVTIDQSGANTAGIESYNAGHDTAIAIRQCKYLNNIVEQDHRAVKRIIRPMLGFKSFRCACVILGGIELMHMVRKEQMRSSNGSSLSAAQQFSLLAA
jgi:putative transposase